jgi:hypothetical protein
MSRLLHIAREPNDRKLEMHEADWAARAAMSGWRRPGVSENPTTNIATGKSESE